MSISAYRETRGLTQEEAAIELGLKSKGYFSVLEQGLEPTPIRVALRMQIWSKGQVQAADIVSADDRELLVDAAAFARVVA